jgi:hypothetical protein
VALIVSDVSRPDHAGVCIVKFQSNGVVDDMNINMNFRLDGWTKGCTRDSGVIWWGDGGADMRKLENFFM